MNRTSFWVLLASTFLAPFSNADTAAWEDPTGSSIFDPHEHIPPPRDVVEAWERDEECLASYFEFTQQNVNNSGIADWYPVWMAKMQETYPKEYEERGEVKFLSTYGWNDPNFGCSST
jgi:hypothetical protein